MTASLVIRATEEEWASLAPGQKRQAKMIAEYSRAAAARYIAVITKPLEDRPTEKSRTWYQSALQPLATGQILSIKEYALAYGIPAVEAGPQLLNLAEQGFISLCPNPTPRKTYQITPSGRALLSLGQSRLRVAREGYKSALLTKSVERRDDVLIGVSDPLKLLNLVKKLPTPYTWEGREFLTTEQVASYYGISEKFVQNHLVSIRQELEADGLKCLKGKTATKVKQTVSPDKTASQLMTWPPRAVIRLGLVIRESPVAIWLRQCLVGGCRA